LQWHLPPRLSADRQFGGMTPSQLLSAEAAAGTRSTPKSVIMVGGPPHQDMWVA
jgi:hypothetical protein